MKKKILSIALAALMALPLAIFASAATVTADSSKTVEVPAEPKTVDTSVYYVSYKATSGVEANDSNAGTSADAPLATWQAALLLLSNGGKIVTPGKGYIGTSTTFPDLGAPVTITAFDPQKNTKYLGTIETPNDSGSYSNGTQLGMFMIQAESTLTIEGEYIFDNIVLLQRSSKFLPIISVAAGGKLVITNTAEVTKMTNAIGNNILNVDRGGYAYLHAVGFEKYTGAGTIVMDKALYENSVTDEQFAEFYGTVVDENGKLLRGTSGVEIKMTVGQSTFTVNGQKQTLDAAPVISSAGRTMLPARAVAEALGAVVGWDGATSSATFTTDTTTIAIKIGSNVATVNGESVTLDSPAYIGESGRTYLPIRFICEILGANVAWDGATSTATITK